MRIMTFQSQMLLCSHFSPANTGVIYWSMLSFIHLLVALLVSHLTNTEAFVVIPSPQKPKTQLALSRRDVFSLIASSAVAVIATTPTPAEASYSAYSHREEDWKERLDNDRIKYSTAKSLRKQLKEIVPMNSEGRKLFCPNGPTPSVSPLMENRCSDELAHPSIYGRTQDVVGNSIPGARKKRG